MQDFNLHKLVEMDFGFLYYALHAIVIKFTIRSVIIYFICFLFLFTYQSVIIIDQLIPMSNLLEKIKKQILSISIMMVGDLGAGKSSIFLRYTQNKFIQSNQSTIGLDYAQKKFAYKGKTVRLVIWDTAGQEKFRSAFLDRYKQNDAIIFVYDMNKLKSLEQLINYWIPTANDKCKQHCLFTVFGSKSDLVQNPIQIKQAVDLKLQKVSEKYKKQLISFFGNSKQQQNKGISQLIEAIVENMYVRKLKAEKIEKQKSQLEAKRQQLSRPDKTDKLLLNNQDYKKKRANESKKKCLFF